MRLSSLMSGFVVAGLISAPTSAIAQMPAGGVRGGSATQERLRRAEAGLRGAPGGARSEVVRRSECDRSDAAHAER